MSLINDALKQARHVPPSDLPEAAPPLQPVPEPPPRALLWLWPSMVFVLLAIGVFFLGWMVAHRPTHPISANHANAPRPASPATPRVDARPVVQSAALAPVVQRPAVQPPPIQPPAVVRAQTHAPGTPILQGLFFSLSSPWAIVDGVTVRPGDKLHGYRVKAISKTTVTLTSPGQNDVVISMGN